MSKVIHQYDRGVNIITDEPTNDMSNPVRQFFGGVYIQPDINFVYRQPDVPIPPTPVVDMVMASEYFMINNLT